MKILETERLVLSEFENEDAPFIFELLNDPDWLRFIGDRSIHSLADAQGFIEKRLRASYTQLGFGFYLTKIKNSHIPIGMCGLIKRDFLPDVDIGFAFLPQFRGQGYALEASAAMMAYAHTQLNLNRILAISNPNNHRSCELLKKLGLHLQGTLIHPDDGSTVNLFTPSSEQNCI